MFYSNECMVKHYVYLMEKGIIYYQLYGKSLVISGKQTRLPFTVNNMPALVVFVCVCVCVCVYVCVANGFQSLTSRIMST